VKTGGPCAFWELTSIARNRRWSSPKPRPLRPHPGHGWTVVLSELWRVPWLQPDGVHGHWQMRAPGSMTKWIASQCRSPKTRCPWGHASSNTEKALGRPCSDLFHLLVFLVVLGEDWWTCHSVLPPSVYFHALSSSVCLHVSSYLPVASFSMCLCAALIEGR
jgi:hypothetical protein